MVSQEADTGISVSALVAGEAAELSWFINVNYSLIFFLYLPAWGRSRALGLRAACWLLPRGQK